MLQIEAFAKRIVLQFGVNLALELPWCDANFGMTNDKSAREVSVFSRWNAAYNLDIINVVGTDLAQVGACECRT